MNTTTAEAARQLLAALRSDPAAQRDAAIYGAGLNTWPITWPIRGGGDGMTTTTATARIPSSCCCWRPGWRWTRSPR